MAASMAPSKYQPKIPNITFVTPGPSSLNGHSAKRFDPKITSTRNPVCTARPWFRRLGGPRVRIHKFRCCNMRQGGYHGKLLARTPEYLTGYDTLGSTPPGRGDEPHRRKRSSQCPTSD